MANNKNDLILHAGSWHYKDCPFPTEDWGVCNCPDDLKPSPPEDWEKEFDERVEQFIYYAKDKFPDGGSRKCVDYLEAKHFIREALQQERERVADILDRHASWKPTCGYESEEEKGYQKGLIAEAKLIKSEIESLSQPKEE